MVGKQYFLCLPLFQYQGLWQQVCEVWSSRNPQLYPSTSEDLTPTVLEEEFASCFFWSSIFQKQWQSCFSWEKYISFHPRPRGLEYSDVCLIWWLGFEQVRCFTAIALREQESFRVPILQAGKLGPASTQLLKRKSRAELERDTNSLISILIKFFLQLSSLAV